MKSKIICIHWITQINSPTVDEWRGSYSGQGQSFDLEATLQYGLLLTFLCGSQQGLRHQRPYRPRHEADKGRTKVTGLLYMCVRSAGFQKDDLKGARVLFFLTSNHVVPKGLWHRRLRISSCPAPTFVTFRLEIDLKLNQGFWLSSIANTNTVISGL